MEIGILGGTFDPIHIGHVHLALSIMKERALDCVYFVLTPLSPFKVNAPPTASAERRFRMVELAIEKHPKLIASGIEMDRQGPCYTIDMVSEFVAKHPQDQHHLLLASDVLAGLHKWKEPSKIIEIAPPLVGKRVGSDVDLTHFSKKDRAIIEKGLTNTSLLDVSSTEIRNRLKSASYADHLLAPEVLDYIKANRLYSCP